MRSSIFGTVALSLLFFGLAASTAHAADAHVLIYYGNGGAQPFSVSYDSLQRFYTRECYPADYTDQWPSDFSPYVLVFLATPGGDNDSGVFFFSNAQIADLENFLSNNGRLVVLGDHSGTFGINTLNDLLSRLGSGVGIRQNPDFLTTFYTTNITADQITNGVSEMTFDGIGTSSLDFFGTAFSLVRYTSGLTGIAVDTFSGPPSFPRPPHDIVVIGDANILDDGTLYQYDNEVFALNLASFTPSECAGNPPVAEAGGPYGAECGGRPATVALDGSASYDPDNDPLTYAWSTDCPGGTFDDATSARPTLSLDGPPPCPVSCTVTLTVTDSTNKSDTDTAPVTIADSTPPVISGAPANTTAECDNVPPAASPTALDTCDASVPVVLAETQTPGACADGYTLTRTWTATDDCGNTATATQTITVSDTKPPTLAGVPSNISVECDSVPAAATPTATDNCDSAPSITFAESRANGSCQDTYTLTRTWTAKDRCGNTSVGTQIVTVSDTKPPTLAGVPSNISVECDSVPAAATPTATDNCDSAPSITFAESRANGSCQDTYTLTRTWTAKDRCGNTSVGTQIVTVSDTKPPTLAGVPSNISVECDSVPTPATPTASDNCDPAPAVTLTETRANGPCQDTYTLTRTWTAKDRCGNTSTGTQTITVSDTKAPTLTGVPSNVTVECDSVPPPATPAASDNCDPAPTIAFAETRANGACQDAYSLTRIWTAKDRCGNTSTGTQVVTVRDTTPPTLAAVPSDQTAECDNVPVPAPVTSADNCDPAPALVFAEVRTDGDCPFNYLLTRSWTATDRCANESSAAHVVTVRDTTPPAVTCLFDPVPDDEDEDGDDEAGETFVPGLFTVRYGGIDNCDVDVDLTASLDLFGNDETCDDETPDFPGYPVEDGDVVRLDCAREGGGCVLFFDDEGPDELPVVIALTGPAMKLKVSGVDACANAAGTECIERCLNPDGCISAITLRNSTGTTQTFYWYEFNPGKTTFTVGGESPVIATNCSKCVQVGDAYGTLTVTCLQAGGKMANRCKLPAETFAGPCP